ncbi:MAG: metallophosphoesterase [Thermoanaerobaculia bacterium]
MTAPGRKVAVPFAAAAIAVAGIAAFLGGGLRGAGQAPPPASPFADGVETLLLVGDAGAPAIDEPELLALAREAAKDPERTLVVFLGDNLYPAGLPAEGDPARREGERRLAAQADAALGAGARVLFVPGNHDWDEMREHGLDAVQREAHFLERRSPRLLFAPQGGCPGPVLLPTPSGATLAVLDTQWWLQHEGPRPEGPGSPCSAKDTDEAVAQLGSAAAQGPLVLLAHHPLATGGTHGARSSDWKAHLFPLRDLDASLWIPLPVLGSMWATYRDSVGTGQDLSSGRYRRLRADLARAFEGHPALFAASGHDHNLQVLEAPVPAARWVLISGSGMWPSGGAVRKLPSTRFASEKAGFMRVRLARGVPPRLTVLETTKDGRSVERFAVDLR